MSSGTHFTFGYISRNFSANPQCVVARRPSNNPLSATRPTPEHTPAMAAPRRCHLRKNGTTVGLRSTTSLIPIPVVGTKTRAVWRISESDASGVIRIGPSQFTARPPADAAVTLKRGIWRFPVSMFHNVPACLKTSIGPTAVEENVPSRNSTVTSIMLRHFLAHTLWSACAKDTWQNYLFRMAYLPPCHNRLVIILLRTNQQGC